MSPAQYREAFRANYRNLGYSTAAADRAAARAAGLAGLAYDEPTDPDPVAQLASWASLNLSPQDIERLVSLLGEAVGESGQPENSPLSKAQEKHGEAFASDSASDRDFALAYPEAQRIGVQSHRPAASLAAMDPNFMDYRR
jgi:hypothetical protein